MGVNDPWELEVECDNLSCGKTEMMESTEYVGGNLSMFGVDDKTIENHGWVVSGEEIYCSEACKEECE